MSGPDFFTSPYKTDARSRVLFAPKLSLTNTDLTKEISQIGPAVPDEIGYRHTQTHTYVKTSCWFRG